MTVSFLLESVCWFCLHLCEEGHLEHVPDMQQVHPRSAHQQLPVSLHILHLVTVVLEGSLVQLLLNPGRRK